ncbi:phosphopantetheinyltransferase component of enterobactin synthase multienzyme complex [Escherichia coli]|nr:phosphopantetheinyltransferase component of enterobactin synthase multienzyme complex [Escherichia coli]
MNALSGLQKSCQFNILQDHVGLISVAHQAVLRLSSVSNMVDMKTTHTSLPFAGHTLHFVEFDPANFCEQDLLWLPHYAQLQHAGRKRKTEHLAGRIAAVYALREYGYKCVPAIGELRQPVWPAEVYGSISHCGTTALAVVSRQPIGIDIEEIFFCANSDRIDRQHYYTSRTRATRRLRFSLFSGADTGIFRQRERI